MTRPHERGLLRQALIDARATRSQVWRCFDIYDCEGLAAAFSYIVKIARVAA